jgi:2-octaprenyl-6-methoxyphenol hydroxylase
MARIFAGSPQGSPLQAALGLSLGAIDLLPARATCWPNR